MGVRGAREGRGPGASTVVAVEDEVGFPVNFDLVVGHELTECASLDHGGQGLLG